MSLDQKILRVALVGGPIPGTLEARRLEMLEQTVQNHMLIPPKFSSYPAVEDVLWMALQSGMTGQRSVREALEVAAEQMREIVHA